MNKFLFFLLVSFSISNFYAEIRHCDTYKDDIYVNSKKDFYDTITRLSGHSSSSEKGSSVKKNITKAKKTLKKSPKKANYSKNKLSKKYTYSKKTNSKKQKNTHSTKKTPKKIKKKEKINSRTKNKITGKISKIVINKSKKRLYIYRNNKFSESTSISIGGKIGKKYFKTPSGTYRVGLKLADAFSNKYKAKMPYSLFFIGRAYAIHFGNPGVSHGCVRVHNYSLMKKIYNSAKKGIKVIIY